MTLRDEIKALLEAPAMNVDDIRTLLRIDHDEALQVARDMVDAEGVDARRALLRQLRPALFVRARAEQRIVYEELRQPRTVRGRRQSADAMIDARSVEHALLDENLQWLAKSRKTGSDEWKGRAEALMTLLQAHVEAEQSALFQALDRAFDDDTLTSMGRRYLDAKDEALSAGVPGTIAAARSEQHDLRSAQRDMQSA